MHYRLLLSFYVTFAVVVAATAMAQNNPPMPKVPDGFDVTIFAQPPEVNYPVCLTAAPTGEVFVGIDKQGSLGKKPGQGRVVRCIDSDGDGKADKINTFAKMDHPRGLIFIDNKLWVLHPPYLSLFHDDNGDGVSDRKEILISGITTDFLNKRGADHTTNGIRMGIDGWIYIAVGDFGFVNAKAKDGKTMTLKGGGVVRIRPDGSEMELYCRGLRNILDVCIDPTLNMFTRDNTNDGGGWNIRLFHLIQSADYGYPSLFKNFTEEAMPPLGEYGGGSGCGGMFVSEPWLPKPYDHALLTCDWGRNIVYYNPVERLGATYQAKQEIFAELPRPTDIDVDGSGRIYISSWHGGKFNYAGENIGYVAQVKPKNLKPVPFPNLQKLNDAELIKQLESASHTRRFYTQREILRRNSSNKFTTGLVNLIKNGGSLETKVAAMYTLKQLNGAKANATLAKFASIPELKEYVLRALTDRKTQLKSVPIKLFIDSLQDKNPRAHLAALIGLARLGKKDAAKHVLPLTAMTHSIPAHNQPDQKRVIPHVAVKTLVALNAVDECLNALDGPHRTGALWALHYMHEPAAVNGLIDKLNRTTDVKFRREILETLTRLYYKEGEYTGTWWGTRPDTTGPYYHRETWKSTPKIETTLRKYLLNAGPKTVEFMLDELARHKVQLKNLPPNLVKAAKKRDNETNYTVTVPKFDKNDPNQIGNIKLEKILSVLAKTQGKHELGAKLFEKQSCIACHTVKTGQKPVGPPLWDIAKRYNRKQIVESIVKPNAQLAQGFSTYIFQMNDGKLQTGFVVREAADEVEIRTSEGKLVILPSAYIAERFESKQSVMPEGLVNNLTLDELAALVAYVESLKSE